MTDTQKDTLSAAKDTLESYRQKAEAWMKDVEANKFPEWKAKAEAAGTEALDKFHQFTGSFDEQKKTLDGYYTDAKAQAGETFDLLKTKAEGAWEDLKAMAAKYTDSSDSKK